MVFFTSVQREDSRNHFGEQTPLKCRFIAKCCVGPSCSKWGIVGRDLTRIMADEL